MEQIRIGLNGFEMIMNKVENTKFSSSLVRVHIPKYRYLNAFIFNR